MQNKSFKFISKRKGAALVELIILFGLILILVSFIHYLAIFYESISPEYTVGILKKVVVRGIFHGCREIVSEVNGKDRMYKFYDLDTQGWIIGEKYVIEKWGNATKIYRYKESIKEPGKNWRE